MNWGKLAKGLAGSGLEILGNVVGGRAGGKLGKTVAGLLGLSDDANEEQVQAALASASPETLAKIRQIDADLRAHLADVDLARYQAGVDLEKANVQAGSQDLENVNKTMQAESAIGDPWSGKWRPVWGVVSAGVWGLTCLLVVVAFFIAAWQKPVEALAMMPVFIGAMGGLMLPPLTILGVASHHRGKMQRIQAGEIDRK